MAATYSYTHGGTTNLDRLRFLLGDHRGAAGAFTGTNQIFSDEELGDLLLTTMCGSNVLAAARIALQCRLHRESLTSGVSGTTDTTDRPGTIVAAVRQLERLVYPLTDVLPTSQVRTNASIDDADLTDMGDDA